MSRPDDGSEAGNLASLLRMVILSGLRYPRLWIEVYEFLPISSFFFSGTDQ